MEGESMNVGTWHPSGYHIRPLELSCTETLFKSHPPIRV